MRMVGHETVAENVHAELLRLLLEKFKIHTSIIVNKEYILMIIAALSDMVRQTFQYYPCSP